jgi:hypothetical protein
MPRVGPGRGRHPYTVAGPGRDRRGSAKIPPDRRDRRGNRGSAARPRPESTRTMATQRDEGDPVGDGRTGATGSTSWTHLDEQGRARMVDVGSKDVTSRLARARAVFHSTPDVRDRLLRGDLPKGEALAVARIAGIQAAKETGRLIPLCHPLPARRGDDRVRGVRRGRRRDRRRGALYGPDRDRDGGDGGGDRRGAHALRHDEGALPGCADRRGLSAAQGRRSQRGLGPGRRTSGVLSRPRGRLFGFIGTRAGCLLARLRSGPARRARAE